MLCQSRAGLAVRAFTVEGSMEHRGMKPQIFPSQGVFHEVANPTILHPDYLTLAYDSIFPDLDLVVRQVEIMLHPRTQ